THGEWMIRAYALGMGAGTQVLTHLPWFILVGRPTELSRTILMGGAWAINAAVAEWIIRRAAARRRVVAAPAPRLITAAEAKFEPVSAFTGTSRTIPR